MSTDPEIITSSPNAAIAVADSVAGAGSRVQAVAGPKDWRHRLARWCLDGCLPN